MSNLAEAQQTEFSAGDLYLIKFWPGGATWTGFVLTNEYVDPTLSAGGKLVMLNLYAADKIPYNGYKIYANELRRCESIKKLCSIDDDEHEYTQNESA